jgi:hypothetical protein
LPECVETKPDDDANILWHYSLPTMAELMDCVNDTADCVNDAWKTSIPTATVTDDNGVDSTEQCLPTPNEMPTFTCDQTLSSTAAGGKSLVDGWPDAIDCGGSTSNANLWKSKVFYLKEIYADRMVYQANDPAYQTDSHNIANAWNVDKTH